MNGPQIAYKPGDSCGGFLLLEFVDMCERYYGQRWKVECKNCRGISVRPVAQCKRTAGCGCLKRGWTAERLGKMRATRFHRLISTNDDGRWGKLPSPEPETDVIDTWLDHGNDAWPDQFVDPPGFDSAELRLLDRALLSLPRMSRHVVTQLATDSETLDSIGARYELSGTRIRQINMAALRDLRNFCRVNRGTWER